MICNDNKTNLQSDESVEWELPSGRILRPGFNSSVMEVVNEHGIPGYRLLLKSVTHDNRGIYVCYVYTSTNDVRTTAIRTVNLAGALYRNMFDKYIDGLIWGIVAALTIVVPCTGGCVVYKYRYKPKLLIGDYQDPGHDYDVKKSDGGYRPENSIIIKVGLINEAYTEQECGELENTKF